MTHIPDLTPDEPMRLQAVRKLNLVETPLEERFERISRQVKRSIGVDIAAIVFVEADRQFFKSIQGLDCAGTSRDVSFCGHTILSDDLMVVPDARKDERFANNPLVTGEPGIVFYAAIPIHSPDGFAIGTLCVIHKEPKELTDEDVMSLRDFAAMAESEIRSASANAVQASLLEDVNTERHHALIDSLTRMWNRAGILDLAEKVVSGAATATEGLALVMVDLDNFKQINDRFGHAAGDAVLRSTSRRMLAGLRETDVIGRLGGDEFLLVLSPCESGESAAMVAEQARDRLTKHPIRTDAGEIPVTASFGIQFVEPGSHYNLEKLLEKADHALYESKRAGRDTICAAAVT